MVSTDIQFTTVVRDHVEAVQICFLYVEEELNSNVVRLVRALTGYTGGNVLLQRVLILSTLLYNK